MTETYRVYLLTVLLAVNIIVLLHLLKIRLHTQFVIEGTRYFTYCFVHFNRTFVNAFCFWYNNLRS